jgi:rSAM/selenodomain-associated transferase 2
VSIIVPVLNEAALLPGFLSHLRQRAPEAEVIVADGGSEDGSRELARGSTDRWIDTPPGRARQMNAGAAVAGGEVLWFLHVDSVLPEEPLALLRDALADPGLAGGCFRLRVPRPQAVYRVTDTLGNLGVDLFRIALGDHGIFCRRSAFEAVGGYPEVPLMEDAELYCRLRRVGRVRQIRVSLQTSPRRYERHGLYRTTLVHALILALYVARVPPKTLARLYARLR